MSGKSTLFKHLKYMFDSLPKEEELKIIEKILKENLFSYLSTFCSWNKEKLDYSTEYFEKTKMEEECLLLESQNLIRSKNFEEIYNKYYLNSSTLSPPFINLISLSERCEEISKEKKNINAIDALKVRVKTTGICENVIKLENYDLILFDVGGARSERRKWIHCFDQVGVVFYTANVNHFSCNLVEDENTNAMKESLTLFEELVNNQWFKNAQIYLFFTHIDMFEFNLKNNLEKFKEITGDQSVNLKTLDTKQCIEILKNLYTKNTTKSVQIITLNLLEPQQLLESFQIFAHQVLPGVDLEVDPPNYQKLCSYCNYEWTKEKHKHFSTQFQNSVLYFLLCLKRRENLYKVPKFVQQEIIKFST